VPYQVGAAAGGPIGLTLLSDNPSLYDSR
jgi:hypothetical protein